MAEQLALIEIEQEIRLTDRQQHALEDVKHAGPDGVDADQIGANWCALKGIHDAGTRCAYDGKSGRQVLDSLAAKGLVTYRKASRAKEIPRGWVLTGTQAPERELTGMLADDQELPY